jgi:ubiquinone/menaquinone biosynthesis C-methylase UbiE
MNHASAEAAAAQEALNDAAKIIYTQMAPDYDRHLLEDCRYATPKHAAALVQKHAQNPELILDAGAGTGLLAEALARAGVHATIVATDLVPDMLKQMPDRPNIQPIVADITQNLPVRDNLFDVAVSIGVLEHTLDPVQPIAELTRTVKPGGLVEVAYVPNQSNGTEIFDRNAGLLSHSPKLITAVLDLLALKTLERTRIPAYQNGGAWVVHEIVLASAA